MRIGIDVGGTHTDAVLLDNETILATNKSLTTSDVASGIIESLNALLNKASISASNINAVMIGTTQFTNAIVERRQLSNIAVIRLALPSGKGCPPMIDWPEDLVNAINPSIYECHGGYLYDGNPVADINIQEIKARKGRVIAVVTEGDDVVSELADYCIAIPESLEYFAPIVSAIPLQLFAYYIAVNKGRNVDQPRNLAKSVTVE